MPVAHPLCLIHGRIRNGQWRYRLFDDMRFVYLTGEMTLTELRNLRLNAPHGLPERLERVHASGTSRVLSRSELVVGQHNLCLHRPWQGETQ